MHWQNRAHFFRRLRTLMRRILVERARRDNLKRGRGVQHVPLDDTAVHRDLPVDFVALDDALYNDLLTLWKNAEIPVLKEARAEYARLP